MLGRGVVFARHSVSQGSISQQSPSQCRPGYTYYESSQGVMLSPGVGEHDLGKGVRRQGAGAGTKIAHAEAWTDAEERMGQTPYTPHTMALIFYSLLSQSIWYGVTRVFAD